MISYEAIIFDLDGVIIDQSEGITSSVKYALSKLGKNETDHEKLLCFIGPPIKNSFMKFYSFDDKKTSEAITYFRERYKSKGIHEFKVYKGIDKMLSILKKRRKKLFIATTKPKNFAELVLKEGKIYSYFDGVYGDTLTFDVSKTSMIKMILKDNKLKISKVVMVGDRDSDIIAAAKNKIGSIGVTYGFGSIKELKNANATKVVKSVKELEKILKR